MNWEADLPKSNNDISWKDVVGEPNTIDRLLIHVEGETEESFVNEVLRDHLRKHGYVSVSARIVGNARLRDRRGGIRSWNATKKDIINHLKEDSRCLATTMVDYYGLPQTGDKAWPGRASASNLVPLQKAPHVEAALDKDLQLAMGDSFFPVRFMPFVIMHEFEGLLFSDCAAFARGIGRTQLAPTFQLIRDQFPTPEEINDSAVTAPSKRVERLVAGYEKPFHGTLAALEIGLEAIRAQCLHFNDWLNRLEAWPAECAGLM